MLYQKAPKASMVVTLIAHDGDLLSAGAPVLTLAADEEEVEIAKVEGQRKVIEAQLKAVSDPQRRTRLDAMRDKIDAATGSVTQLEAEIAGEREQMRVGEATEAGMIKYRKMLLEARLKLLKVRVERDAYEVNTEASQRHLRIVLDLLDQERKHFDEQIARLTVATPVAGRLSLNVGVGSPCRLGFTLFSVG